MKWEPAALMVLVLGLGMWLALGPASRPNFATRPGATLVEMRIANSRGVLESSKSASGQHTFRVFMQGHDDANAVAVASPDMTADEVKALFGEQVLREATALESNRIFRTLKITSWVGVAWVGIGLLGQLAFSGRMVLQWFVSERRKESVITESFWWFSLFGSLMLFSYFVWRQDPVGILGQASGLVIYARNIRLIHKKRRRARRDESRRLLAEAALADAAVAESAREVRSATQNHDAHAVNERDIQTVSR